MPEEETTASTAEETTTTEAKDDLTDEERAAVEKADNPDAVRNAIQRQKDEARKAREEAAAAKAEAQKLKDEQLSDQERKDKTAREATERATQAETKALKYEVAATVPGFPLSQAHRLTGSTKEELKTDAEALLKDLKGDNGAEFDGGARGSSAEPDDMDARIRRAAGRA